MEKTPGSEFVRKDGTINTERAIEAGNDARTAAIIGFAAWLSSVAKAVIHREAWQRI